ncbi:MAG: carboxymuconolactone decarboxylase family protein, partial [Acidimicrobiales bacterium]
MAASFRAQSSSGVTISAKLREPEMRTKEAIAMIHPSEVLGELREPAHELREQIPDVIAGYSSMARAAMADGALAARVTELIALAIAVTRECDGCIASHARSAAKRGA